MDAGGVLLDRGEAHLDVVERALRRRVAVVVDVTRVLSGAAVGRNRLGVEIGIRADAVVELPADELVDRLLRRLAEDVPHRDLDPAEHAHHRDVGPLGEACGVHAAEQGLDVVRVLARDVTLEGVLHHPARDVAGEGDAVALPDPLDAVVGGHLHDDPERPADTVGRDGHPSADVPDLHAFSPSAGWSRFTAPGREVSTFAIASFNRGYKAAHPEFPEELAYQFVPPPTGTRERCASSTSSGAMMTDEILQTLWAFSFAMVHEEHIRNHREALKDTIIWNTEKGLALGGMDVAHAEVKQAVPFDRVVEFFGRFDYLVCPTTQVPPFSVDTDWVREIDGRRHRLGAGDRRRRA